MRNLLCLIAVAAFVLATGCTSTRVAKDFSGLQLPEGSPKAHVNTSNIAIHLLFSTPLWGDSTLPAVVKDCTAAAKAEGASHIRLVQSDVTTYWWILPPITFIVQPVTANAAGDAY